MPISDQSVVASLLAALPWLVGAPFLAWRIGDSPSLLEVSGQPPLVGVGGTAVPRVSLILPARNEAAHITDCLRTLRSSTWPDLEIIVVDDASIDGTGDLARAAAASDARVRVLPAPPLEEGWFGKQWACHHGAAAATGALLLFTDADTRHAPDLITRMVATRAAREAELLSVAGRQEAITFWERAVQPMVFALIVSRYGGGYSLERARRATDVLANGQCFMLSRAAYDAIGGHVSVRGFVAEDLMMAQTVWRSGRRVSLARGLDQLSTRMYDGFASLVKGWSKNVYAGGRHAMRGGRVGRALFPFALLSAPLSALVPPLVLLAWCTATIAGATWPLSLLLWSALATVGVLASAAVVNRGNGDPWYRAPLAIPGAVLLLGICAVAIVRRSDVTWKDRRYVSD